MAGWQYGGHMTPSGRRTLLLRSVNLDSYWLEILFFLIGEHADIHAHQVTMVHQDTRPHQSH